MFVPVLRLQLYEHQSMLEYKFYVTGFLFI